MNYRVSQNYNEPAVKSSVEINRNQRCDNNCGRRGQQKQDVLLSKTQYSVNQVSARIIKTYIRLKSLDFDLKKTLISLHVAQNVTFAYKCFV